MGRGILPSRKCVERLTKDLKREPPPSRHGAQEVLKCCGSRPSEPPPDHFGNDDTTFKMKRGSIVNDDVIKSMGIGCVCVCGGGGALL